MRSIPAFLLLLAVWTVPLAAQVPLGNEVRVNQSRAGSQAGPDLGFAADGSFVVVWASTQDLIHYDVWARRFGPNGRPRGGELRVSRLGKGNQGFPAVAVHPDGSFVVVWTRTFSRTSNPDRQPELYASRFDANGQPQGKPRLVAFGGKASDLDRSSVVALPDDGFFVAWSLEDGGVFQEGDIPSRDIYGRRFTHEGVLVGGRVTLNADSAGDQSLPKCVLDRGEGLACTWTNDIGEGSFGEIAFRRFDLDGVPLGDEVQVNLEETAGTIQNASTLAVNDDGVALVVWHDPFFDPILDPQRPELDGTAVAGRLLSSTDQFITSVFRVHTTTRGMQSSPSTAASSAGFAIAWSSTAGEDGSGGSILLRTLTADGTFTSGERIVNQKRAGDQGNPALALGPQGGAVAYGTSPGDFRSWDVVVRRLRP